MALTDELRLALRRLHATPLLSVAAVMCLAVGFAAVAALYPVVEALLLQPPRGVVEPRSVKRMYATWRTPGQPTTTLTHVSYPVYRELFAAGWPETRAAAYHITEMSVGLGDRAEAERVALVTSSYFPLLGLRPALGRFFTPEENALPVGTRNVVLGYAYWRSDFGGDARVLGRHIFLRDRVYRIVGVAPPGFIGVDLAPVALWIPLSAAASDLFGPDWSEIPFNQVLDVLLRVGDSASASVEQRATEGFRRAMGAVAPVENFRVSFAPILEASGAGATPAQRASRWLVLTSLAVLLIASSTAVGLQLVRMLRVRGRLAIEIALGAPRSRLVRQCLVESALVAAAGAALGLLVAVSARGILAASLLPVGALAPPLLVWRSAVFVLLVWALTTVVTGLVPARIGIRMGTFQVSREWAANRVAGRAVAQRILVAAQVALMIVLVTSAAFFLRSLQEASRLDLGVEVDHVVVATFDLESFASLPVAMPDARYAELRALMRRTPGVHSVAMGSAIPFGVLTTLPYETPGSADDYPGAKASFGNLVTPAFFETLGMRVLRGRGFTGADVGAAGDAVAVVNAAMAARSWPGEDPIGKCIRVGRDTHTPCRQIVGVVRSVQRAGLRGPPRSQFYIPITPRTSSLMDTRFLFARTTAPAQVMVGPIRGTLSGAITGLPYLRVGPLADRLAETFRPWRNGAAITSLFGGLAWLLAGLGLFGFLMQLVAERRRELAVRIAVGAARGDVIGMVLREMAMTIGPGLVGGFLLAALTHRVYQSVLYHVSPYDPIVLAGVAASILLVAFAATLLPAALALRADPAVVLRAE